MRYRNPALLGSLFAAVLSLGFAHSALAQGYVLDVVAEVGGATPVGGTYSGFVAVGSEVPAPIDLANNVYFLANVAGGGTPRGIFRGDPAGAVSAQVVQGGLAPSTGGGTYGAIAASSASDAGTVAFFADVVGGTEISGLFVHTSGGDSAVVFLGDPRPAGGTLSPTSQPDVNDAGDVVFHAFISILGGSPSEGILVGSGGLSDVATNADAAPSSGGGTFSSFGRSPAINDAGDVAFVGNVSGGSFTQAIYRYDAGTAMVEEIAHLGQAAPVPGGGTIAAFSTNPIAIDDAGTVYFSAALSGGTAVRALFRATPGILTALVVTGDVAPGTGGSTFADLDSPTAASGPVVSFTGAVLGIGTSVFATRGGPALAVALTGDVSPTGAGDTLQPSPLFRPSVNAAANVGFLSNVAGPGPPSAVFRATLPAPPVPTLPWPAVLLLGAALLIASGAGPRRAGVYFTRLLRR